MKAKEKYQNSSGTVVIIDSIRGDKVFFTSKDTVAEFSLNQRGVATLSDFIKRFPIKVK